MAQRALRRGARRRGGVADPVAAGASVRNPDTELDTRFSDTGAIATGWEETRRALEQAELSWISTVRAHTRQPLPRPGYADIAL